MNRKTSPAPRIAVLLPAYNASAYIDEAVGSILAQTYPHFDLWVINDGSKDDTEERVRNIKDPRIKLINNPKNMGLIGTLNRGLDLITKDGRYDYVARMDADDTSLPERFRIQVDFMAANPDLGLCSTAMQLTGTKNGKLVYPTSRLAVKYAALGMISKVGHASALMKCAIFESGEVRYDPEYPHAEDTRLWSVINGVYPISNINTPLYNYFFNEGNVSTTNADAQRRFADKVHEHEFERFIGRSLTKLERPFVLHQLGTAGFEAYVRFYEEMLAAIIAKDPDFRTDVECQRLVARMVTRTVLMNRRAISAGKVVMLVQRCMVDAMGIGWWKAAYLLLRSMAVVKLMNRKNAL